MTQPFADTLARIRALDDYLGPRLLAGCDAEPGWLSVAALTAARSAPLAKCLAQAARRYTTENRQAPVSLWYGNVVFFLMAVPIVTYLTERRVPALGAADLELRFDEQGEVTALAWLGRSFAALPGDPAAGQDDCQVVASLEDLRAQLREQVVGVLEPLVPAVAAQSPLGRPALWALAADCFASTFAWAAGLSGPAEAGASEVSAIAAPAPRLRRPRDFILIEHAGQTYPLLDRVSCCLFYAVEGGDYCTSCPHRPPAERIARIQRWLERKAAA